MNLRFAGLRGTKTARARSALLFGLGFLLIVPARADGQETEVDCDPAVAERDPACAVQTPQEPLLESETPLPPGPARETLSGGQAEVPAGGNAQPEPGGPSGLLPADGRGVQPGRSTRPADPAR